MWIRAVKAGGAVVKEFRLHSTKHYEVLQRRVFNIRTSKEYHISLLLLFSLILLLSKQS